MPIGDRLPRWRHRDGPRRIRDGDEYTSDELERGEVQLEEVPRRPEPPVEVQGEPWGWTKGPPYPRGWREDGDYGGQSRDDPGPYDGSWERP
jgi:hypothetical protein